MNRDPRSPLPFTGRFYDGLGNKLTMRAYANPTKSNFNAAGHAIVRFKKSNRSITFECWPRHVDVSRPDAKQFPGWPITIRQEDNYDRAPIAHLPEIRVEGAEDPVVQIIDEFDGEVVYTLRIRGAGFRPKVFREGSYTVKIRKGDRERILRGVRSLGEKEPKSVLRVRL